MQKLVLLVNYWKLFESSKKVSSFESLFSSFVLFLVGKPVTDRNTTAYRKRIFDMISGNCLLQRDNNMPKEV